MLPDGVALLRVDGVVRSANGGLARLLECPARSSRGCGSRSASRRTSTPPRPGREPSASASSRTFARATHSRRRRGAPAARPPRTGARPRAASLRDLAEVVALRSACCSRGASPRSASSPPASRTRSTTRSPSCARTSRCCAALGRDRGLLGEGDADARAGAARRGRGARRRVARGRRPRASIVRDVHGLAHAGGAAPREGRPGAAARRRAAHRGAAAPRRAAVPSAAAAHVAPVRVRPAGAPAGLPEPRDERRAGDRRGRDDPRSRAARGRTRVVVLVEDDGGGIAPEHPAAASSIPSSRPSPSARGTVSGSRSRTGSCASHGGEITRRSRSRAAARASACTCLPSRIQCAGLTEAEAPMKLYDSTIAPNPRRVRIFLAEKGISGSHRAGRHRQGREPREPPFLAKNPLGGVPVLELDDGTLHRRVASRSAATSRRSQPQPPLFGHRREGSRVRRDVAAPHGARGLRARHADLPEHPRLLQGPHPAGARVRRSVSRSGATQRLAWLDGELAGREFIAGDRYTIADITALCGIDFGRVVKHPHRPEHEEPAALARGGVVAAEREGLAGAACARDASAARASSVSEICLGTMTFGSMADEKTGLRCLDLAFDAGRRLHRHRRGLPGAARSRSGPAAARRSAAAGWPAARATR